MEERKQILQEFVAEMEKVFLIRRRDKGIRK